MTLDADSPFSRPRLIGALAALVLIVAAVSVWLFRQRSRDQVSFSRDIQPMLNQNCVQCHGGVRQKNGVSFVFR